MKLKSSLKAGIKVCTRTDGTCADSNHSQATALRLKTSLKAGIKVCTRTDGTCMESNHNQTRYSPTKK